MKRENPIHAIAWGQNYLKVAGSSAHTWSQNYLYIRKEGKKKEKEKTIPSRKYIFLVMLFCMILQNHMFTRPVSHLVSPGIRKALDLLEVSSCSSAYFAPHELVENVTIIINIQSKGLYDKFIY